MTDPAKYWPGGIPSHIQCYPGPIHFTQLPEEIKGWQLFLEENAIARQDGDHDDEYFEVTQRRQLVSRWAALPQADRDGYQARGSPRGRQRWNHSGEWLGREVWYPREALQDRPPKHDDPQGRPRSEKEGQNCFCVCTAPYPLSPRHRAIWTKLRILCYALDGGDRTLFGGAGAGDEHGVGVLVPNAAGPNPAATTGEEYLRWCHLEAAVLDEMAMTSKGTVIFYRDVPAVLLADERALDSGLMLLCQLENNGGVVTQARVWPFTLDRYWPHDPWSAERMILEYDLRHEERFMNAFAYGGTDQFDARGANMEDEIMDILESLPAPRVPGSPDVWLDYIERYAPGYLEMEAEGNGMVYDYDHSRFRTMEELETLPLEDDDLL
ncbi:hypothetical protein PG991_001523 [Apiospora marii]|uniref:Uncharacterized protein n=1 Tax=Apiospora marii TaxID=335849 RepID=A0ABR1SPX9_9PEZI